MVERRKLSRITWKGKVRITDPLTGRMLTENGRLRNIGKHGFAFMAEAKIVRGMNYQFKIDLEGIPLELTGKVVHLKQEMVLFTAGVAIDYMSFPTRMRLNRFLSVQSDKMQRLFLTRSLIGGLLVAAFVKFLVAAGWPVTLIAFIIVSLVLFFVLPF